MRSIFCVELPRSHYIPVRCQNPRSPRDPPDAFTQQTTISLLLHESVEEFQDESYHLCRLASESGSQLMTGTRWAEPVTSIRAPRSTAALRVSIRYRVQEGLGGTWRRGAIY